MRLRAHAKINLNLAVLGARPDGYHELRTTFQSLALHDTLEFEGGMGGWSVACDVPGIPLDESNLVSKAARLVWEAAGRSGEPAGRARIAKRIPAQAGLGGGSADGAAALVGWNRVWDAALPAATLAALAARLGADVPFFLCAGTAVGRGRGDRIDPLPDEEARAVVLVMPRFGVPTPQAFGWWDEDHAGTAVSQPPGRDGARGPAGRSGAAVVGIFNDLEPPVLGRHPELGEVRALLLAAGAREAAMTGSGSTMFGLFDADDRAGHAADALRDPRWQVVLTRTATREEAGFGGQLATGGRQAVTR